MNTIWNGQSIVISQNITDSFEIMYWTIIIFYKKSHIFLMYFNIFILLKMQFIYTNYHDYPLLYIAVTSKELPSKSRFTEFKIITSLQKLHLRRSITCTQSKRPHCSVLKNTSMSSYWLYSYLQYEKCSCFYYIFQHINNNWRVSRNQSLIKMFPMISCCYFTFVDYNSFRNNWWFLGKRGHRF